MTPSVLWKVRVFVRAVITQMGEKMISMDDGFILLFIGSTLRLMLESMQVLFQVGFSECFLCFTFWRFRFEAVPIIYSSAKFWLRIPIDVANRFFCSILGPTVETDVEVDEGSAWACFFTMLCSDWQLGWFSDISDGAILRLWFLRGVGLVERQETILCSGALAWSISPA